MSPGSHSQTRTTNTNATDLEAAHVARVAGVLQAVLIAFQEKLQEEPAKSCVVVIVATVVWCWCRVVCHPWRNLRPRPQWHKRRIDAPTQFSSDFD